MTSDAPPVVVALSTRLRGVLPAAATRLLRDGTPVHADADVPAELAQLCGANPVGDAVGGTAADAGSQATGAAARG